MKDRIKLIRQNAGMTQQEFAKQIGVSRNTIATYETSVRIPIDAIVLSICREFNINETWLRTGEGNMYMEENPDFMLSKWFGEILREESSSFKKQLILALSQMSEREWSLLQNFVDTFVAGKTSVKFCSQEL